MFSQLWAILSTLIFQNLGCLRKAFMKIQNLNNLLFNFLKLYSPYLCSLTYYQEAKTYSDRNLAFSLRFHFMISFLTQLPIQQLYQAFITKQLLLHCLTCLVLPRSDEANSCLHSFIKFIAMMNVLYQVETQLKTDPVISSIVDDYLDGKETVLTKDYTQKKPGHRTKS